MGSAIEPTLTHGIIFSDSVIREHGTGKLTLVGTFQHFNAPQIPFQCAPFFVTVSVTNLRGSIKDLKLSVRVEEESSGYVVCSSTITINAKTDKNVDPRDTFEIPLPLPAAVFPNAGVYRAVILANNEQIGFRNLIVRTVTAIQEG